MELKFLLSGILCTLLAVVCIVWAIVGFAGMAPGLAWSMTILTVGFMISAIVLFSKL